MSSIPGLNLAEPSRSARFAANLPDPASPIRLVGFVFDPNYTGDATLLRVNRSHGRCDGGLINTYGLAADELATLMNEWLNRYKRSSMTSMSESKASAPEESSPSHGRRTGR